MKALDELFSMLAPKAIIPIHTDNPQAFADLFCDKWPVILLNDGEYFAAIRDPWFDITEAKILAYKQPDKSHRVIENSEGLRYWSLDERSLVSPMLEGCRVCITSCSVCTKSCSCILY